jgi:hypothetical protein
MTNEQLSLFEQARVAQPGLSDDDLVRTLCRDLLQDLEIERPVNVEMVASARGISSVTFVEQDPAGMLLPDRGRLHVRIRGTDSPGRQRFTILHEAGHTLLPGFSEKISYRCNGEMTKTEALSDIAAAELLFPRNLFMADASHLGYDMEGVEGLATLYDASVEASARRLVELSGRIGAMLVFTVSNKPSELGTAHASEPVLRLKYSFTCGNWPFFPQYKSVPDSPFQRALEGEIVDEVAELGELTASSVGPVSISARRYGQAGRVIALIERRAS